MQSNRYASGLRVFVFAAALGGLPVTGLAQDPGSPAGSLRTPASGVAQPGKPQPGFPSPGSTGALAPAAPRKPLDPSPIVNPKLPGAGGPTLPCGSDGNPRKVFVRATPSQVRSGSPVTLRVSVECPVKTDQRIDFNFNAPGVTDRSAGETMVAFVNQIPRTTLSAGSLFVETTFTPRGLTTSVNFNLTAATQQPSVASGPTTVSITGDGVAVAPTVRPTAPAAGCVPRVTLNALQTGVIGGANVTVDLTLSCAPAGGAVVQVITQPGSLLPGPPGGTVTIPAGQTRFQLTLQAARQGSGNVTLRAVMSQPAGGISETDTVSVSN